MRGAWSRQLDWSALQSAMGFGIALSGLTSVWPVAAQEPNVSVPAFAADATSPRATRFPSLDTVRTDQLRAELARREAEALAEAGRQRDSVRDELDRLRRAETQLSETLDDELRRDQNARVLDTASQLEPDDDKVGLLRRVSRVFARHSDIDDARTAAKEIAPTPLDPAAFERAKALVVIAEAEQVKGSVKQAWWSLHEAQEIALKLRDQEQALTVFRRIGEVETKLSGGQTTLEGLENDALIEATIKHGVPNPGFEEVEILRVGGGPLREPQVIRHVYFPTGARKFQGPMLRGGPTIVHVVHPRTNCPCDAHLVLPRGAPIIEYSNDEIDYLYPDVEINLHFHRSGKCTVRASRIDTTWQKCVQHLTPQLDESGFWFFGGETNTLKNACSLVSGPVLNVGSRLPITSGLIRPEEKRIRDTLRQPNRIGYEQFLKRESVR